MRSCHSFTPNPDTVLHVTQGESWSWEWPPRSQMIRPSYCFDFLSYHSPLTPPDHTARLPLALGLNLEYSPSWLSIQLTPSPPLSLCSNSVLMRSLYFHSVVQWRPPSISAPYYISSCFISHFIVWHTPTFPHLVHSWFIGGLYH